MRCITWRCSEFDYRQIINFDTGVEPAPHNLRQKIRTIYSTTDQFQILTHWEFNTGLAPPRASGFLGAVRAPSASGALATRPTQLGRQGPDGPPGPLAGGCMTRMGCLVPASCSRLAGRVLKPGLDTAKPGAPCTRQTRHTPPGYSDVCDTQQRR